MKCTECGRHVRPIAAIDIDGTLAEYHHTLTDFACNYHNVPVPNKPWDGKGNFEDHLGLSQAQYREAKLAYRQGGYKRVAPVMDGAERMMADLKVMGFEIWITTTRPWSRLDSVDPDTRFWLERHGFYYDHLLFDENKYAKLATIVDPMRVRLVVEDLPEMVDGIELHLPRAKVCMPPRDHNRWFMKPSLFRVPLSGVWAVADHAMREWKEESRS